MGNGGWNRGKRWIPSDKDIQTVSALSGYGLSKDKVAAILGISKDTLERAEKKHPALREAVLKGFANASLAVTQSAFKMATSGKQPAMTIFWLKVREGWKDTSKVEVEAQVQQTHGIGDSAAWVKETQTIIEEVRRRHGPTANQSAVSSATGADSQMQTDPTGIL